MLKKEEGFETIMITEAQARLDISRSTLWRLIRTYGIETFSDVLDSRVKLVRVVDVEKILEDITAPLH